MKLPNGYGSVTKLSGNRRNPYQARVTIGWDVDKETGKVKQKRVMIGSYATKKEAIAALGEYMSNPYDISNNNITLEDLYNRWQPQYFEKLATASSRRTITAAWSYCSIIKDMKVKDIRARHLKGVIEDAFVIEKQGPNKGQKKFASPGTKARMKSLFNLLFDYALEYELVAMNYARTFDLSSDVVDEQEKNKKDHIAFSEEELNTLWEHTDIKCVDWIIIQTYMGWRPQEMLNLKMCDVDLDNWLIKGGMKTKAGIDRQVPIHSKIKALVVENYNKAKSINSEYLFNDYDFSNGSRATYDKYRLQFTKIIKALGMNPEHRPHDPRKTFITMAKKVGMDEFILKRLVGHAILDITESVYTERDFETLRAEVEKL